VSQVDLCLDELTLDVGVTSPLVSLGSPADTLRLDTQVSEVYIPFGTMLNLPVCISHFPPVVQ